MVVWPLLLAAPAAAPTEAAIVLESVGSTRIPRGLEVGGERVGGLSGLAYDPGRGVYYALSDDRGRPRFYTLDIDTSGGTVTVIVESITVLRAEDGSPLQSGQTDAEAIARTCDGLLWIATEGIATLDIPSSVAAYAVDGRRRRRLELPPHYLPDGGRGVRDNLAFEGLAVTPDRAFLFVITENALVQDGAAADLGVASPSRILKIDLATALPAGEFLYEVSSVPSTPVPADAYRMNGASDLLALDENRLLVLERSFSVGVGNQVRLYEVDLDGADDLSGVDSIAEHSDVQPVPKVLVSDFGITADNLEGMTFGPPLPDGRRLLVVVSDDNFNPRQPETLVEAYAVSGLSEAFRPPAVAIADIQGRGHSSPMTNRCVTGVRGVVTATAGRTAWIQSLEGDDDPATSEGLELRAPLWAPEPAVGDVVSAAGLVVERGRRGGLTTTILEAGALEVVSRSQPLPEPVLLGARGRRIPDLVVDDDSMTIFEPASDAIDFFESFEGMRLRIEDAVVVGPTSRYGDIAVLADGGAGAVPRTSAGGVALRPGDSNPARILIADRVVRDAPMLRVGDRLSGPVDGVLGYSFGNFKLYNTAPLPPAVVGGTMPELTELRGDVGRLSMATINLENLSARSDDERFRRLGVVIARHLSSPDIVALQEVQDNSGSDDDGTISAAATLDRLVEAVVAAGGPHYCWSQIDPVDGADGGQPGGNIRLAYLVDPARAQIVLRNPGGALDSTGVADGPWLTRSPGRIAVEHPAFAGDEERGWDGGRKPLAAEFEFEGRRVFVVDLHLRSKWGDDGIYGARQPPLTPSDVQRTEQARLVAAFVGDILDRDAVAAVIVLGDLNDFEFKEPVKVLAGDRLVNLVERLPIADRYSYVYQGNSQVLDHILVSPALAARAEIDVVHVHADFPVSERGADHDPVLAVIDFGPPPAQY